MYAFDAAYKPDLRQVLKAGGVAINCYITGKFSGTTTQPSQARSVGLGSIATYEEDPSELVKASREQGQAIGRKIMAGMKAKGYPPGTAVYSSVDVYVNNPSDVAYAYLGINDIIAPTYSHRSYAEGAIIDYLVNHRLVQGKCWLSASKSYPGYNANDENVCMRQLVGSSVIGTDADALYTVQDVYAIGAWWPPNSPYLYTLLEWIMTLPGAPKNLTYQQLVSDIAAASATNVAEYEYTLTNWMGTKETEQLQRWIACSDNFASEAVSLLKQIKAQLPPPPPPAK